MARDNCARFRTDLSGFVDQTLPDRRWEQVGYHVAGCEQCRREADEIRRVRAVLQNQAKGAESVANAPDALAAKLRTIAGDAHDQPLYMDVHGSGELPSKRQTRSRHMKQTAVVAMATVAVLLVAASLMAPAAITMADPVHQAREEYTRAVTAINVEESLGAMLFAYGGKKETPEVVHAKPRSYIPTTASPMDSEQVAEWLRPGFVDDQAFVGVQTVLIANGQGQYVVGRMRVEHQPAEGVRLTLLDSQAKESSSYYVPDTGPRTVQVPPSWQFAMYDGMDQVAGRWTKVIEAHTGSDGRLVARWWVDVATKQVLWTERYDAFGVPNVMAGFDVIEREAPATVAPAGAELMMMERVDAEQASAISSWCRGLKHCPRSLAGLPLVAHSTTRGIEGTGITLVYSDGFRNMTVQWTPGRVDHEGVLFDSRKARSHVAVWQAGDGVISVVSNGDVKLLHQAVSELPPVQEYHLDAFQRIGRGLARMVGSYS